MVARQLERQLSKLKGKRTDEEACRWVLKAKRIAALSASLITALHNCRVRDLEAALSARDEALREVRRERNALLASFRRLGIPSASDSLMSKQAGATLCAPTPSSAASKGGIYPLPASALRKYDPSKRSVDEGRLVVDTDSVDISPRPDMLSEVTSDISSDVYNGFNRKGGGLVGIREGVQEGDLNSTGGPPSHGSPSSSSSSSDSVWEEALRDASSSSVNKTS